MAAPEVELEDAVFVRGRSTYARPTSIHHWQLRDLISAGEGEDEFLCVHHQRLYAYNAARRQSAAISSLEFAANSMTARHGFLAAGGLHGELEVRDLAGGNALCFKGCVGSTVNNALHIAKHSDGEARLFVCCNDSSIKVFRLPSMDGVTVVRCPCPINYAALSPDGAYLVAVGDCEPTLLYQATPTGYTLLSSFTEAVDVGMCAAWNAHGSLLASCHQDGTVAVWEQRSGACVARLALHTAARCLKFSAPPLDLLAVSEHEERVSLVDARRWDRRQVLRLSGASPGASPGRGGRALDVSGLAFSPSGARLWVGLEECVMGYDVDSLTRRTFGTADIL
ncbi:SPCC4G3.03 [Scenedesmus sp. PABB004]|nr:SPCC4G3.03 [Scenedesmus sp. PABB004]